MAPPKRNLLDELSDEDFDLIAENTGVEVRKRVKRVKFQSDDEELDAQDSPQNQRKKQKVFDESDDFDESASEEPLPEAAPAKPAQEFDDMADFIASDEYDDLSDYDQEQRRHLKRRDAIDQEPELADQHLFDERVRNEAQEIFGDDFEFALTGVFNDAVADKHQAPYEDPSFAQYAEAAHQDTFYTLNKDVPESLLERDYFVREDENVDDAIYFEALWIKENYFCSSELFSFDENNSNIERFFVNLNCDSPINFFSSVNRPPNLLLVNVIQMVLYCIKVYNYDLPTIYSNRLVLFTPLLKYFNRDNSSELSFDGSLFHVNNKTVSSYWFVAQFVWTVNEADKSFVELSKKVNSLAEKFRGFQLDNLALEKSPFYNVNKKFFSDIYQSSFDLLSNNFNFFTEKTFNDHLCLYHSLKSGGKNSFFEKHYKALVGQGKNYFSIVVFIVSVFVNAEDVSSAVDDDLVDLFANEKLQEQVESAVVYLLTNNPIFANSLRNLFVENGLISVEPTSSAADVKIHSLHPYYSFKYVRDKLLARVTAEFFVKLNKAVGENLLKYKIYLPQVIVDNFIHSITEKLYNHNISHKNEIVIFMNNALKKSIDTVLAKRLDEEFYQSITFKSKKILGEYLGLVLRQHLQYYPINKFVNLLNAKKGKSYFGVLAIPRPDNANKNSGHGKKGFKAVEFSVGYLCVFDTENGDMVDYFEVGKSILFPYSNSYVDEEELFLRNLNETTKKYNIKRVYVPLNSKQHFHMYDRLNNKSKTVFCLFNNYMASKYFELVKESKIADTFWRELQLNNRNKPRHEIFAFAVYCAKFLLDPLYVVLQMLTKNIDVNVFSELYQPYQSMIDPDMIKAVYKKTVIDTMVLHYRGICIDMDRIRNGYETMEKYQLLFSFLPGMGEKYAEMLVKILFDSKKNNEINGRDDLLRVAGFGPNIYFNVCSCISFSINNVNNVNEDESNDEYEGDHNNVLDVDFELLDASAVHPELYDYGKKILIECAASTNDTIEQDDINMRQVYNDGELLQVCYAHLNKLDLHAYALELSKNCVLFDEILNRFFYSMDVHENCLCTVEELKISIFYNMLLKLRHELTFTFDLFFMCKIQTDLFPNKNAPPPNNDQFDYDYLDDNTNTNTTNTNNSEMLIERNFNLNSEQVFVSLIDNTYINFQNEVKETDYLNIYLEQNNYKTETHDEDTFSIYNSKIVSIYTERYIYKKSNDRDRQHDVQKDAETNMFICPVCYELISDELNKVWKHIDERECPGRAVGVVGSLDLNRCGPMPVYIYIQNISNNPPNNLKERVLPGMQLTCRIIKISQPNSDGANTNLPLIEASCRTADLADGELQDGTHYKVPIDLYFDKEKQHFTLAKLQEKDSSLKKMAVYQQRLIKHADFCNMSYSQTEEHMRKRQFGEYVFRPSSKGTNHLTLSYRMTFNDAENVCVVNHVDIIEEDKQFDYSLGRRLWIGQESYEDLDEIIARYLMPILGHVREMATSRFYYAAEGGSRLKLASLLQEEKKKAPKRIPYIFSTSKAFVGHFAVAFLPGSTTPVFDYFTITPDGYRFHDIVHGTLDEMIRWFKTNFRQILNKQQAMAASGRKAATPMVSRTPGGFLM